MSVEAKRAEGRIEPGARSTTAGPKTGTSKEDKVARGTDVDRTLGRTAAWLAKQVELGLGPADLSLSQYRVLGLLDASSAVSSDLAERLAVSPPSVTAVVDGLVGRGLVERRTVVADRRRVEHVLTADGRSVLDNADAGVAARLREIAHCLGGEQEAACAFDGLAAWRSALRAYGSARRSRE